MGRTVYFGFATILMLVYAKPSPAEAEISLISAWQHCEPTKGCLKFAFLPNGHVIEQFPLDGSVVTAYGHYHIRGAVLKIGWHRFEPTMVCGASANANDGPHKQCISTGQEDIKGPFHFEGMNALLWAAPSASPLHLVRIQL
jgi:hypothetical protein